MYQVILLYLILILHILGNILGWYYTIPHFDTLMHFLGGFWMAMFVSAYFSDRRKLVEILFLVGVTMIIGFGWEFYEFLVDTFIFNKTLLMQQSVTDIMTDLTADFLGALVCSLIKKNRN